MRLTLDVIMGSPQFVSPSKNWTLCIRGCKIGVIENLGATDDHFESIDLSDNEILKLANLPPLPRLNTLLLSNNRISRIDPLLCENVPNLVSLVLTNNKIERLTDIQPLFKANKLERLSLLDNPVCQCPYYRLYVIYNFKHLRFLDFKKIRDEDRAQAKKTFDGEKGKKLIHEIAPPRASASQADVNGVAQKEKSDASALPPEQLQRIKDAIAKATTLEEITRLENALQAGYVPEDLDTQQPTVMETDAPSTEKSP